MNRRELEEKLIAWAWQDAAFKQELLSNPKATIEKKGIKLTENIEVRVVEETPTTLYLVIPVNPNQSAEGALGKGAGSREHLILKSRGLNVAILCLLTAQSRHKFFYLFHE